MKYFISPILQQTPIANTLSSVGIDVVYDSNTIDVDGFVLLNIPDKSILIDGIQQLNEYVNDYKLNTANYLNAKYNIPGRHDLNNVWTLHQSLVATGHSSLETVFPTTEQQIIDFFALHGSVVVKPTLTCDVAPLSVQHQTIRSWLGNVNNVTDEELAELVLSIPTPSSMSHYYKVYDTWEQFAEDVDIIEFLNIQNSESAQPIHQCVLQKNISYTDNTHRHASVVGYVNGNNQIIFDPIVVVPLSEVTNGLGSETSFVYDNLTEQDVLNALSARIVQSNQSVNIENILQDLFTNTDTRNTQFTAQFVIDDQNNWIPFHITTGKLSSALRKKWITSDQIRARLQFMNDLEYDVNHLVDSVYRFWFEVRIPTGINRTQLMAAADYNIIFMLPARVGQQYVPCTAYGNTAAEVAANFRAFMDLCNPLS